eukprot:20808-Heterococcus_DN1.PRE.2
MWARHSGCYSPEYELDGSAVADNDAASVALSFDGDDIGGFEVLNLDDDAIDAAAAAAGGGAAGGAAEPMQEEEEEQL